MMKLKYRRWRERAKKVLEIHGEMTMHILIDHIPYMKLCPMNVNSATQLLLKDKRFTCREADDADNDMLPTHRDKGTYRVMIWGLVNEN